MISINSQNQYCQYHRLEGLKDYTGFVFYTIKNLCNSCNQEKGQNHGLYGFRDYTDFIFYTIKNLCNSCNQRKSVIQTNKRINTNLSNINVNG